MKYCVEYSSSEYNIRNMMDIVKYVTDIDCE
jgi:hypothetical protein